MQLRLRLGHTTVSFLADSYVPWDHKLSAFCCPAETSVDTAFDEHGDADFVYTIHLAQQIHVRENCLLRETRFFKVYTDGAHEVWYYTFPDGQIYACCREEAAGHFSIHYLQDLKDYLAGNVTLFYLAALEDRMIKKGDMILHSSYILDQDKAILFTAPSGTGKSTQAHLWQDARGSQIINGDRALLQKGNDGWYAGGWPMSGSSGISTPHLAPIRAVVVLSQSSQNLGHRLTAEESFDSLKQEIVLRPWSSADIALVGKHLRDFCGDIPVYAYACRKDASAVTDLLDILDC